MEEKLDQEWHQNIIGHLGALLYTRDVTLETIKFLDPLSLTTRIHLKTSKICHAYR